MKWSCLQPVVLALLPACTGDCSDLYVRVIETDSFAARGQKVGVGLGLYVDVYVQKTGVNVFPDNLAVIADVESTVDVNIGAIPIDRSGQPPIDGPQAHYYGKVVGLTPLAAGKNGFVFVADNTDQTTEMSYEGVVVDALNFLPTPSGPEPYGAETTWFTSNRFPCFLDFRSGNQHVLGTTDLLIDAPPNSNMTYVSNAYKTDPADPDTYFELGYQPYVATLSTPVRPETLKLNVVDETGIASLRLDPTVTVPVVYKVGDYKRIQFAAHDASGLKINGFTSSRATSMVQGTSVTVGAVFNDQIAVEAVEVGPSTITLTWSGATLQIPIEVMAAM